MCKGRKPAFASAIATGLGALALAAGSAFAADAAKIDWSKVPSQAVTLFYPGQSSYTWLRSSAHAGAAAVEKQACTDCHKDNEKARGAQLVKGGPLEPTPVKGKVGYTDLKVQAAYDDKNAYFRFEWKTTGGKPGVEYPYYRFDGKEWKPYGGPRLSKVVQSGEQPAIYEDRLTMMIDDGKVPGFAQQGCWVTCHEGERDMPNQASGADAQKFIKRADVRKYLPASRTNPADWRTIKSPAELAQLKAAGGFVDFMQWRASRSNPMGMADDGFVLEFRNFDAGANSFASNMDGKIKQPKYMYDSSKPEGKALKAADIGKNNGNLMFLYKNAVPFDPNAGWKEGDMLPQYYLQDAKGSAADNKATGTWRNGVWTVVMVRPLGLANDDDKAFRDGGVYNVGFAVHDNNITTRGHNVSYTRTLGFGAKADIQAVKLK